MPAGTRNDAIKLVTIDRIREKAWNREYMTNEREIKLEPDTRTYDTYANRIFCNYNDETCEVRTMRNSNHNNNNIIDSDIRS